MELPQSCWIEASAILMGDLFMGRAIGAYCMGRWPWGEDREETHP